MFREKNGLTQETYDVFETIATYYQKSAEAFERAGEDREAKRDWGKAAWYYQRIAKWIERGVKNVETP